MKVNQAIPKSRIAITYDMEVEGTKKKKELPFRELLIGDLSLGNSTVAFFGDYSLHSSNVALYGKVRIFRLQK